MSKDSILGDLLDPEKLLEMGVKKGLEKGGAKGAEKVTKIVGDAIGDHGIITDAAKQVVSAATKFGSGKLVTEIVEPLFGRAIEPVSYEVSVSGGPDIAWHVRRMRLEEAISEPFRLSLELVTELFETVPAVDKLLGADLIFTYGRSGVCRSVCGVISEVTTIAVASDTLAVRVAVVPALASLTRRVDARIFQDQTVPDILEKVLGNALGEYGRKVDVGRLNDNYLVRDYCVQFKESDLEFCQRLMAEEGISYYFEVAEGAKVETLVLTDHNPGKPNEDFPVVESILNETVPLNIKRPDQAETESLQQLEWSRPEQVTKVTTRQFNWKRPDPGAPPEAELEQGDARGRVREIYLPDERRRVEDQGGDASYEGTTVDEDESRLTAKRLELLSLEQGRGQGSSNVTGFLAGGLFVVADHPHPDVAEAKLLLTRVVHLGEAPEQDIGAGGGEQGARYENSFSCISAESPFRPPGRPAKPKVYGAQTATVTGPASEEIHTDIHGRIKVKFHWDRLSSLDETSSCWVRVAQMWGGPGWGTWFLPRIGMEVVVQFLDGNPDRPLVTGCVYNGENKPPYPLPDDKTKSTIKTNSSIGGGGFNELRFEDMKDAEQIYVHAQKDLDEVVRNNRTRSVGCDETVTVSGNRQHSVSGNEAITVSGNRTMAVSGGHNLGVGNLPPPKPGEEQKNDAEGGKLKISTENEISLECGAAKLVLTKDGNVTIDGLKFTFTASNDIVVKGATIYLN